VKPEKVIKNNNMMFKTVEKADAPIEVVVNSEDLLKKDNNGILRRSSSIAELPSHPK
jgi:hypothetical protein